VAFAHQNLDLYRREVRGKRPSPAELEAIGLKIALKVARIFRDRGGLLTAEQLGGHLFVPVRTVREVLRALEEAGIVAPSGHEDQTGGCQLGRPAEDIAILDVIGALRGTREAVAGDPEVRALVSATMLEIDEGAHQVAAGRTLADLLAKLPHSPKAGDAAPGVSEPSSV
jgi:DNA-binding IscR family transcriptional regulator